MRRPLVLVLAGTALGGVAASAVAQHTPWLRPVARLVVPHDDVVVAALSPDGATLAAVDHNGGVRLIAVADWSELRRFELPQRAHPLDAAFAADGATVLVRVGERQHHALRADDGTTAVAAWVEPAGGEAPPELRDAFPDATAIRPARDGSAALFRSGGQLALWRGGAQRWLGTRTIDAKLTGGGDHVVMTCSGGVQVHAVRGGTPWHVPHVGTGAIAAPFGVAGAFVALDRRCLVLADAATSTVTHRTELAPLGITLQRPSLVAARADGKRVVVADPPFAAGGEAWVLDVDTGAKRALPALPAAVAWSGDGLVLAVGRIGPCSTRIDRWLWLADGGSGTTAPVEWPEPPLSADLGPHLPVHAGELLLPFFTHQGRSAVGRFRAHDGAQTLRRVTNGIGLAGSVGLAGDHVVCVRPALDEALELRSLDGLELLAETAWEPTGSEALALHAAAHARRILVQRRAEVSVFDLLPERAVR